MKGKSAALAMTLSQAVALYILNQKRDRLVALEQRYAMTVEVAVDAGLIAGAYRLESTAAKVEGETPEVRGEARGEARVEARVEAPAEAAAPAAAAGAAAGAEAPEDEAEAGRKRRRRRRRRRRPGEAESEAESVQPAAAALAVAPEVRAPAPAAPEPAETRGAEAAETAAAETAEAVQAAAAAPDAAPKAERKPRRPRRRTGTRRNEGRAVGELAPAEPVAASQPSAIENGAGGAAAPADGAGPSAAPEAAGLPVAATEVPALSEPVAAPAARTGRRRRSVPVDRGREPAGQPEPAVPPAAVVDLEPPAAPRRGWWSRFVHRDE